MKKANNFNSKLYMITKTRITSSAKLAYLWNFKLIKQYRQPTKFCNHQYANAHTIVINVLLRINLRKHMFLPHEHPVAVPYYLMSLDLKFHKDQNFGWGYTLFFYQYQAKKIKVESEYSVLENSWYFGRIDKSEWNNFFWCIFKNVRKTHFLDFFWLVSEFL